MILFPLSRTPANELVNWHTVGYDPEKDPQWSFAPTFCLAELDSNATCQEPAGIAAVSFKFIPHVRQLLSVRILLYSISWLQCNVPTCVLLAPNSKILDMYVANRENEIVEVDKVNALEGHGGIHLKIPRHNDSRAPLEGTGYNLQFFV